MSPAGFRVLWPDDGLEGTMKNMAGRKRHSAEDIVRKLRRADELAAQAMNGEQVAAERGVSPATLYNWRRAYGGMDADASKEFKELREQNTRLKRLPLYRSPFPGGERCCGGEERRCRRALRPGSR
jgi:putative transposase